MKKPQSAADKTNLGQVGVANKNGVTALNKKTNNLLFFFFASLTTFYRFYFALLTQVWQLLHYAEKETETFPMISSVFTL